jgi:hypothetical protein
VIGLIALALKAAFVCSILSGLAKQKCFYNIKFKSKYVRSVEISQTEVFYSDKGNTKAYSKVAPHCFLSTSICEISNKRVMLLVLDGATLTRSNSHHTRVVQMQEATQETSGIP